MDKTRTDVRTDAKVLDPIDGRPSRRVPFGHPNLETVGRVKGGEGRAEAQESDHALDQRPPMRPGGRRSGTLGDSLGSGRVANDKLYADAELHVST